MQTHPPPLVLHDRGRHADAAALEQRLDGAGHTVFLTAERLIRGSGTAGSVWQGWLAADGVASHRLGDWLPCRLRLVVVAPHADGDRPVGGRPLVDRAAAGKDLQPAPADGAGRIASLQRSARTLEAVRRAESAAGWAQLGLHDLAVFRLGPPDGPDAPPMRQLADCLNQVLHPADVVASTWRHDARPQRSPGGLCTLRVCALTGCRLIEVTMEMWRWALPGELRLPWRGMPGVRVDPRSLIRLQASLAARYSQLHRPDTAPRSVPVAAIVLRPSPGWLRLHPPRTLVVSEMAFNEMAFNEMAFNWSNPWRQ